MSNIASSKHQRTQRETVRIGNYLNEVITIRDEAGNILHKITKPLMVEFNARDFMQVIVGATLLGIPVAFTEEVWDLGTHLPFFNVGLLGGISLLFIGVFVYYNYYRDQLSEHLGEFLKRVFVTYATSFFVIGLLLIIIQRVSIDTFWILGVKRIIIVALPASLSAAIADVLK